MPFVVNGFGTWYYGRRNVHQHIAVCEFCQRYCTLESHDTTLYITALFVPIIPLGQQRLIDKCPHCTKHRVIKLHEWERQKESAIREATELYAANPADPQTAFRLIGASVLFEDETTFLAESEKIEAQHAANPDVLMGLARAYAFFNYTDAAVSSLEQAIALRDDVEFHEYAALLYLHLNQPASATPHLLHVLDKFGRGDLFLFELAMRSLQAHGQHAQAIELIDRLNEKIPETSTNKPLVKLAKVSEKHVASGKAVGRNVVPVVGGKQRESNISGRFAKVVGPIILLFILASFVLVSWVGGNNRTVHVVNGLDREYWVLINGVKVGLSPKTVSSIQVKEGDVTIVAFEGSIPAQPQTVHIATSFFSRPFVKHTFAINPDETAVYYHHRIAYSANPQAVDQDDSDLTAGRLLMHWTSIEYPFENPPESVTLRSQSEVQWKDHVSVLHDLNWQQRVSLINARLGKETAAQVMRRFAEFDPADEMKFYYLTALLEPAAAVEYLRPRLAERPLNIEVHRMYQHLTETAFPDHDLEAEYRLYLDKEPGSADLQYLLGRATVDPQRQVELLTQATRANPPSAYAFHALAFHHLVAGRFDKAMHLSNQCMALNPDSFMLRIHRQDVLHASGEFATLLMDVSNQRQKDPTDFSLLLQEVYYAIRLQKDGLAESAVTQYFARARELGTEEQALVTLKQSLDRHVAYIRGDRRKYLLGFTGMSEVDPRDAKYLAIMKEQFDDPSLAAPNSDHFTAIDHLLIYATASSAGNTRAGEQHRIQAVAKLRQQGGRDNRTLAGWIDGSTAPTNEQLLDLSMSPDEKRQALAALGTRFPEIRPFAGDLLEKLNYDLRPPYLQLRALLEQWRKPPQP